MTQHNDAIPPAPPRAGSTDARRPEDIEREIGDIRSRMDSVIDEIEFRLSPGQMGGGVAEVVRDVIQGGGAGTSGRIARAIRANPIPVALMGVGALWLAWAVSRTPEVTTSFDDLEPGTSPGTALSDQRARLLLIGLIQSCRHGATGFRRADMVIDDTALSGRLTQVADQLDRSATALESELPRYGGSLGADEDLHPVWHGLHDAFDGTRARSGVLLGLEGGLEGTLSLFRDALRQPLPEHLQVAIGAQFHEVETVRHRVGALREAVA
ncbi:DUF3618 domain-containing protein [Azospirillum doebereinerae]|uniref:DUF3618 domain-containing protein n=1 Tax=Azospirillum doebereinerae TaxID=92933 RepID=A0A3S0UY12_9PROT|nr:DUF3618 domain-containing protein [Azospirillum doebereinerae]MCG5243522.1 DUF3618 domain-containing protein [Azospirillum doebereinerae]RUQ62518.1 DUF3618 domain-containing protein [Azospirillum doebereinerae]